MNSQNTRLLATLVAATALLGASTASAAGGQPEQRTISLRGLDPATPVGAHKLYREIVTAANRVCGGAVGGATLARHKARKDGEQCTKLSITGAVRTVDVAFGLDLKQLAGAKRSHAPAVAQAAVR